MKPPPRRGRAAKTVAASDPVTASVSVPQILLNELTIGTHADTFSFHLTSSFASAYLARLLPCCRG